MTKMIEGAKKDSQELIALFLRWRIWKARNRLVYENKREQIFHIIKLAIADYHLWNEANKLKEEESHSQNIQALTLQNFIPVEAEYYCLTDASWTKQTEIAGIGWALYREESTLIVQVS